MRPTPLLFLLLALPVLPAGACLHPPADYEGSAEATAQEAILFWADGRQEMILKNDFRITPGPGGQLPDRLAWVVPVPNAPDGYSVEDRAVFEAMFKAWEEHMPQADDWDADRSKGPEENSNSLELLAKVSVGEYEIQPIRAKGAEGARALDAWLAASGFPAVPAAQTAYYVERGWVWLAVQVRLARGPDQLTRQGSLRPLRLSFASDAIVYPLLFSAAMGTFDVNLYVVTARPIDGLADQVAPFGFEVAGAIAFRLPGAVQAVQEKAAREGRWKVLDEPTVHKLIGRRINGPDRQLIDWKQDFSLETR